jgi:protease-4
MADNNGTPNSGADSRKDGWEHELIRELAMESVREKRRARRWGIFFKLLLAVYLVALLVLANPNLQRGSHMDADAYTALIEVKGVISADSEARADYVVTGLREAYEDEKVKGIILRINSPGGSPVQAGYIYDEIRRLREKHEDIPVYAVVADICASGGYYIAAAADEIYVDKASVVGSIGVLMNGFGFEEAMQELGIERRLLTAGEHKAILDPFSPLKEFDKQHIQNLLNKIHQQFITAVETGRGDRLQENDQLFSGLFWTGEESVELGLADGLGSSSYVARELIGAEDIVDFTRSEDVLERFAKQLGAGAAALLSESWGPVLR